MNPPSFQIRPIVHVWKSGILLDAVVRGPQDYRNFILQKSLHSTFDQFRRRNYVILIKQNFWCHHPYKVQIHVNVRKV
jgi:hypothetical protein